MPVGSSRLSGSALLSGYQMNAREYAEYSVECSLHPSGVREELRVPKYNLNRGIKKEIKKLYWHLRWAPKRHRMCGYLISFLSRSFAWPWAKRDTLHDTQVNNLLLCQTHIIIGDK